MKRSNDKDDALVTVVRKRLWSHGYSVQTARVDEGFDLMVEGSVRVVVMKAHSATSANMEGFDVLAGVEFPKFGKAVVVYARNDKGKLGEWVMNPSAVFISRKHTHDKKEKRNKKEGRTKKGSDEEKETGSA